MIQLIFLSEAGIFIGIPCFFYRNSFYSKCFSWFHQEHHHVFFVFMMVIFRNCSMDLLRNTNKHVSRNLSSYMYKNTLQIFLRKESLVFYKILEYTERILKNNIKNSLSYFFSNFCGSLICFEHIQSFHQKYL